MGGRGGDSKIIGGGPGGGGTGGVPGAGPGGGTGGTPGGGPVGTTGGLGGSAGGGPLSGFQGQPGQQQGQGVQGNATAQKSQLRFERQNGALNQTYKKQLEEKFEKGTVEAKRVYDKVVPDGGKVSTLQANSGCYYSDNPSFGNKADTIDINKPEIAWAQEVLKSPATLGFTSTGII